MKYQIVHVNDPYHLDKYNSLVGSSNTLVMFYMDGCGYCEMMKPEWLVFEKQMSDKITKHNKSHMIARVNRNYLDMVEGHKSVDGFPTIYYLKNGEKVGEYKGDRSAKDFSKFVEEMEKKQAGGVSRRKTKRVRRRKTNKSSRRNRRVTSRRSKRMTRKSRNSRRHGKK